MTRFLLEINYHMGSYTSEFNFTRGHLEGRDTQRRVMDEKGLREQTHKSRRGCKRNVI